MLTVSDRIIQLKRRAPASGSSSSNSSAPAPNPFINLNNGAASTAKDSPSTEQKNPFGFLAKPATVPKATIDDAQLKQRALNEKFAEEIAKLKTQSVYGDWSEVLQAYLNYQKKLKDSNTTDSSASTTQTGATNGFGSFGSSGSTGSTAPFSFGAPSTTSASSASTISSNSFGNTPQFKLPSLSNEFSKENEPTKTNADPDQSKPQPATVDDSDSDSSDDEIKITGPKFTMAAPLSTSKDSPFSFSKTTAESNSNIDSGFRFKPTDGPKSVFKFEAPKLKTIEDEKPTALSETEKSEGDFSESKPFSFNQAPASGSTGVPSFGSFGSIAKENNADSSTEPTSAASGAFGSSKPFNFGSPASSEKKDEPKGFSFGSASSGNQNTSTAFSFGSSTKDESKPFTFGATPSEEKQTDSKPFTFGTPASEEKKTENKPFTFGAPVSEDKKAEIKPFTFGATPSEDNKGVSAASKPFSFAAPGASDSGDKPKSFSFGAASGAFGSNSSSTFSFNATSDHTWSPEKGIKFASGNSDAKDSSKPDAPEVAGIAPSAPTGDDAEPALPQVDLSSQGAGEEEEESIYEKRAKAYELVDKQFKVLGVGPLRLLKHKTTGKTRLLLRADGSGRVILNTALKKEITYKAEESQVRVLDIKSDGTPTTYLLRVKTKADASELSSKLEELKG